MNASLQDKLARLAIPPTRKRGSTRTTTATIGGIVGIIILAALFFAATRDSNGKSPAAAKASEVSATPSNALPAGVALTVSGYVIPRERIEISPRFQGTVKWIGVKKGDVVKQGDILVQLEDEEQRARLLEADGRVAQAHADLSNAVANLYRLEALVTQNVETALALDEARRVREVASAQVTIADGNMLLAKTYSDWCTIRAPIAGTILEKLVNPNELVSPQSYGGTRGPSTAFLAMADLRDLQVEIDLNEADTPKVRLGQRCRISPEAYPDKVYSGSVAEIAPEANRSKGTLQVKVQVEQPDLFLTPELTAKVDFLTGE